ncbi:Soluble aldose sugar dehydrogenase YliI precursor [Jannaschia seosinensis]|uniref:Soluble aldose sugar dehydrogenase YliI n=1 Tax=Jannaschia seosinensis TaxID=313367 RepID=A0A0M7BHW2_9RHOB|nr:Soluble aldose sugar dehydrogenase YliI precursor [Jannaschia seosinensis]
MGPLYGDEINVPLPGRNYGWPVVSNGENYNGVPIPHHETDTEAFARPLFYWRPAISPSGMAFYEGETFPDWQGDALIGALSAEALVRVSFDGETVDGEEQIKLYRRVRDVIPARDGAILLLTDYEDGKLLRLSPVEAE